MSSSATVAIEEVHDDDGGLHFVLKVEQRIVARARASAEMLDDMMNLLGWSRDQVAEDLKASLSDYLHAAARRVSVTDLTERSPLCFVARYRVDLPDGEIAQGVVTYDVANDEIGPEYVPAIVRREMRIQSHKIISSRIKAA